MVQDLRIGLRNLRQAGAFATTAILTLALGIGLATAVFTVADALLLRPLPVRDQDRLVVVWGARRDGTFDDYPMMRADAFAFARRARSMERVEFFTNRGARPLSVRDGSRVFRLRTANVSGGFFDLLGARPLLGRATRSEDDIVGAAPVMVLSYRGWQQFFGGDSNVVGRRLVIDETGAARTIVGVMPQGLDFPRGTDFWSAEMPAAWPLGSDPLYLELDAVGRLRPGASPAQAAAELTDYFSRSDAPQWQRTLHGVAHSFSTEVLGDSKAAVMAFAAAACLLLIITCVNVANLLLVRGLSRVREIAVRSTLGASRGRIIGQLVGESAILSLAGGILGTGLAAVAVRGFLAVAPDGLPRLDEIHMNGTAFASAFAITAIVTVLFALAPAIVTSRVELQDVLRAGARQSGASRGFRFATEALVAGQVALALVVLSAAGLIARSLINLERVGLGFEPSQLLIGELAVPYATFGNTKQQLALLDRLVPRLQAIPGVRAVSPVLAPPFAVGGVDGQPSIEGQSDEEKKRNPIVDIQIVAPSYFSTLGIPVLRGRAFTDDDRVGAPPTVLISESVARHYWPGQDPIGKRLVGGSAQPATVVGVVPETRYRDLRTPRLSMYFALRQSEFPVVPATLAIRTDGRPADLTPAIRRAISDVDPGVALLSALPFEQLLERPRAQPRLNALLLSAFAVAAVSLAAVGLYAVMATLVRQRTRELGVRMALGATGNDLLRMVIRRALTLAAIGAGAGLAGALFANQLLSAMLFEVSPTDALTLAAVAVALLVVAVVASIVPARSSARIDPATALRSEG